MAGLTFLIALTAGFNAIIALANDKRVMRWSVVVYWGLVFAYWTIRTMEG